MWGREGEGGCGGGRERGVGVGGWVGEGERGEGVDSASSPPLPSPPPQERGRGCGCGGKESALPAAAPLGTKARCSNFHGFGFPPHAEVAKQDLASTGSSSEEGAAWVLSPGNNLSEAGMSLLLACAA